MKIAMPKNEDIINQHFGKSKSFQIITIEDGKVTETKELSAQSLQHNHGGLAGLLIEEDVNLIITGGIGQGALDSLKEANFEVIRGVSGKIEDIIDSYLSGELKDKNIICNHDHGDHQHKTIKILNKGI